MLQIRLIRAMMCVNSKRREFVGSNPASYKISTLSARLRRILDFERSRNMRQASEFCRKLGFMRWFPVAFLTNDALIMNRAGFEFKSPAL